jgi:hypothetical protein
MAPPRKPLPPPLSLVAPDAKSSVPGPQPPSPLGPAGLQLWRAVHSDFEVSDVAGIELLMHACQMQDRLQELTKAISRDGAVVQGRYGPQTHPALREEISTRSFIVRTLQKLGLNYEAIKPIGRPPNSWKPVA